MIARKIDIPLGEVTGEIDPELIAEADPLEAGDHEVLVEGYYGRYRIVDGFHRVAGYIAHGEHPDNLITVIEVLDEDLCADAAQPGPKQQDAINMIIREA